MNKASLIAGFFVFISGSPQGGMTSHFYSELKQKQGSDWNPVFR
jgi:hypothetical protein